MWHSVRRSTVDHYQVETNDVVRGRSEEIISRYKALIKRFREPAVGTSYIKITHY